jgi:hypothetical protein
VLGARRAVVLPALEDVRAAPARLLLGVREESERLDALAARLGGTRRRGRLQHAPDHRGVLGAVGAVDVQQFSVDTHPDQQLVAYTAEPGSPSHEALGFLLRWSARIPD